MLALFSFLAVAAPLLTPFDPQASIVGGSQVPPVLTRSLPGGQLLSENLLFTTDPGFSHSASAQGWVVSGSSDATTGYSSEGAPGDPGSLAVNYNRQGAPPPSGQANFTVYKQFSFPYVGPPSRFIARVAARVTGASLGQPVEAKLILERVGDVRWTLWNNTFSSQDSGWVSPSLSLDSTSNDFKNTLGLSSTTFSAAEIIFPSKGQYLYGVQITITDTGVTPRTAQVFIDQLDLKILGTSYGLLGTDAGGRDLFTQFTYGTRVSLLVGLVSAFVGIGIGLIVGLLAGYLGKIVDEVLMRFTDMMLVIPGLPLLIVLAAILGPKLINLILVLGFLGWMGFARVIRSQVLSLKERPFIEAAKAAGAGSGHILTRHIMPNIVSLTYVNLALTVPASILGESALAFLGLFDPTVMSWGRILNNAETQGGLFAWWWVIPPGVGIAAVSLSFVLIGFALDELFNPRLRMRR